MTTTLNTPFSINPDIKGVFDADGKDILGLSDNDDTELVRVVNQHDQLVELNKELIEALDYMFDVMSKDEDAAYEYYLSLMADKLNKAKELNK